VYGTAADPTFRLMTTRATERPSYRTPELPSYRATELVLIRLFQLTTICCDQRPPAKS
jgi:hypothetical protein